MFYKMCQEMSRGYSRKRENVKVLTNSAEQRGQDQNDKNTTLKTKKQMNNMDPIKKTGRKLWCAERVSSLCFLQDTRHVAHVVSG